MPEGAVPADHDVPVVAVLDLQEVGDETVRGQTLNELFDSVFAFHDILHRGASAFQLVDCQTVLHELDYSGVVGY